MLFSHGGIRPFLRNDEPGESGTGDGDSGDGGDDTAADKTQADEPKYVTQDALDSSLKSFQDGLFSMVRKLVSDQKPKGETGRRPARATPAAKKTDDAKADDHGDDATAREVALLRDEMRFRDSIDGLGLGKAQRERMWKLYRADQPDDPEAWAKAEADALGWLPSKDDPKKAITTTAKKDAPEGDPKVQHKGKPISDSGSTNAADGSTTQDILSWTNDDVIRWFQQKGIKGARHLGIQNRAALTEFRQMYENKMRDVRVTIPRQGQK